MNAKVMEIDTGVEMEFIEPEKYERIFENSSALVSRIIGEFTPISTEKNIGERMRKYPDKCIYYTADTVAEVLGVSISQAYKVIHTLNNELSEKGYITIAGRVSKKYFHEKYYGYEEMIISNEGRED